MSLSDTGRLAAVFLLVGVLLASVRPAHSRPQTWSGPISPIEKGYGANGVCSMVRDTLPARPMRYRDVYLFSPEELTSRAPVVFLFPAFKSWEPVNYNHFIQHIVSRGYCVVFAPYKLAQFPYQARTYRRLFAGAVAGLRALGAVADTSRIGFAGHSFGGSALPAFAWECLHKRGWGVNGAFMHVMAPFFMFRFRENQLSEFPSQVKLLVQVFEHDDCNDHRMAKDLFEAIGIPPSEKDFVVLRSDTCPRTGYRMRADHAAPFSGADSEGEVDGVDFYGVFRPFDALADYAFTGNENARRIALGNGDPEQRYMGRWPDGSVVRGMLVSDEAPLLHPRNNYFFRWSHPWNLRRRRDHVELDDPWGE